MEVTPRVRRSLLLFLAGFVPFAVFWPIYRPLTAFYARTDPGRPGCALQRGAMDAPAFRGGLAAACRRPVGVADVGAVAEEPAVSGDGCVRGGRGLSRISFPT